MLLGFELTTFGTWVSSHIHLTRAPSLITMSLPRIKWQKSCNLQSQSFIWLTADSFQSTEMKTTFYLQKIPIRHSLPEAPDHSQETSVRAQSSWQILQKCTESDSSQTGPWSRPLWRWACLRSRSWSDSDRERTCRSEVEKPVETCQENVHRQ